MVKRYNPLVETYHIGVGGPYSEAVMIEDPHGDYVLLEDLKQAIQSLSNDSCGCLNVNPASVLDILDRL